MDKLKACDRPKPLLPWPEAYFSYLLMRHEQHAPRHDLCDSCSLQVTKSYSSIMIKAGKYELTVILTLGWRR